MPTTPRIEALTSFEKEQIRFAIQDIIDDSDVRTVITYTSLTGGTYDVATGDYTRTETVDANVNTVRRLVTEKEIERQGALLSNGDWIYVIEQADLTNEPAPDDTITDGSDILVVLGWEKDALELIYKIFARARTV